MYPVARSATEGLKPDSIKILVSDVKAPEDITDETPLIDEIKTVSSYNWLDEDEVDCDIPTVQVPGAPPLVSFPTNTPIMELNPDSGHHFVDQNAARMKGVSGMVPGLAACHSYKKDFNIADYDVVCDRNSLIKLFELVELANESNIQSPIASTPWRAPSIEAAAARRKMGRRPQLVHPFFEQHGRKSKGIKSMDRNPTTLRIDVDLVSGYDNETGKYIYDDAPKAKTMVLSRWEPTNEEEVFSSLDFRGFGFSFLTKTRRFLSFENGKIKERGPKEVTGYHCLVEYKLFGMKMLVRYHADSCDMTREEFIKWISQDGFRDLSESTSTDGSDQDSKTESEDETLCESPTTETFDLLDAFKTLTVKSDDETDVLHEKLTSDLKEVKPEAHSFKLSTLPKIPLDIIQTPNIIFPGNRIVQVKTRGLFTGLNREPLYTQLFFSQTPKVFVAYHNRGVFNRSDAKMEDVETEMLEWALINKESFKKLIGMLREIRQKAGQFDNKAALGFRLKKKDNKDTVILDIQARDS